MAQHEATATTTTATNRDNSYSSNNHGTDMPARGLERSESMEWLVPSMLYAGDATTTTTSRPSWCGMSAVTVETATVMTDEEELGSSFSSLISSQSEAVPPPPTPQQQGSSSTGHSALYSVPALLSTSSAITSSHHYQRRLASAPFFTCTRGMFAPEDSYKKKNKEVSRYSSSSSTSSEESTANRSSAKQRRGRRRSQHHHNHCSSKGSTTAAGPSHHSNYSYHVDQALMLEVPSFPFPAELRIPDVDHRSGGGGGAGAVRDSLPGASAASSWTDSARQRREVDGDDDVVDVLRLDQLDEVDVASTTRKHEDDKLSSRKELSITVPLTHSEPAAVATNTAASLVCQCCYDEIDPNSTMPTFTCGSSIRDHGVEDPQMGLDSDDEDVIALPPKPTDVNMNHAHSVCGHCLASYVHEWVFGGTNYPLRKQPGQSNDTSSVFELPCLSPNCPTGSYSRSDVQHAVTPQALERYDEKMEMYSRGSAATTSSASHPRDGSAPVQTDAERAANPPASPSRNRAQLEREETLTERRIRRCAVCCAAFVKESNTCNKIRCPHCNFRFCFVCLTDLPAKGYDHFCTHQYDAACQECVNMGVTCHLWSHEVDSSARQDDDDDVAIEEVDVAHAEVDGIDLVRRRFPKTKKERAARHVADATTKEKYRDDRPRHEADRFLRKLLPARKVSKARRATTTTRLIIDS